MEVVAFILGVFGISAYLQISGLKNRIAALERELTSIKGTSYHEDRGDLVKMVKECIGKKVKVDLKEDHLDIHNKLWKHQARVYMHSRCGS